MLEVLKPRDILERSVQQEDANQNLLTSCEMLADIGKTLRLEVHDLSRMFKDDYDGSAIYSAYDALRLLRITFKEERLPDVIRRSARVFNGRRAIDWIIEGRIEDVAVDLCPWDIQYQVHLFRNQEYVNTRYPQADK